MGIAMDTGQRLLEGMMHIPDILDAMATLLMAGNADGGRPAWLRERAAALRSSATDDQRRVVLEEIERVLAGMGGLSDVTLAPPSMSGMSRSHLNATYQSLLTDLDGQVYASLGVEGHIAAGPAGVVNYADLQARLAERRGRREAPNLTPTANP